MITAENVSCSYGAKPVLQGVSLHVSPGEVMGLIGPNGSGKTTLLRTLYGSLIPDGGRVRLDGEEIHRIPARRLAQRLAVVAQEAPSDLMLSVADVVLLGRTPHLGTFERQSGRDRRIAARALQRVGALHLADREFNGLSGGERQRVVIARALAQEAGCILLDEPTNHLDISYQHEVLHLVRQLGTTAVVVLHDLNLAARYCDSILLLEAGRQHAYGTPEEVLTRAVVEPVYRVKAEPVVAEDAITQLLFRRTEDPR